MLHTLYYVFLVKGNDMDQKKNYILLLGIIIVSTNLRAPITSVGPLASILAEDLHLSAAQNGLVTTIPLVAFAIVSPLAPKIAARFSIERTIFGALLTILFGMGVRFIPSILTLFVGTSILGCGIAICNVLIPGLVKKEFYHNSGLVTGLFSVSMNLAGAIASGVSIPLVTSLGMTWNKALSIWAILTLVSIVVWLPQLKKRDKAERKIVATNEVSVWKSPLAWCVTLFMGIQSFVFYALVAWLPQILADQGVSAAKAGSMLSLLQLTILPLTFIVPIVAEKVSNQKLFVIINFGFYVIGIFGLMFGQGFVTTLAIISLGVAGGIAFGLVMMFFNLRTTTAGEAAELSGMAQSMGYLLAAVGPFLFGFLYDQTGNWQISLFVLIGVVIIFLLVGLKAGSDEVIA